MARTAEPSNVRLDRPGESAPFLFKYSAWRTALAAAREAGWEPQQPGHSYSGEIGFEFSGPDAAACAMALQQVLDAADEPGELDQLMLSVADSEWRAMIEFLRRGRFFVRSC
jgi:hypothetical protein